MLPAPNSVLSLLPVLAAVLSLPLLLPPEPPQLLNSNMLLKDKRHPVTSRAVGFNLVFIMKFLRVYLIIYVRLKFNHDEAYPHTHSVKDYLQPLWPLSLYHNQNG
mgnify:CR=1 FL=1